MFEEVLDKAARFAGLDVRGGAAAARERSPARGKGA